ncbi:MAG TPA: tetratricopeptide repeat protein [Cyclobacteriaceae bacterium]|nr:tetratricopeptide repeat protein [Cyclobacteriaceae bacterium]
MKKLFALLLLLSPFAVLAQKECKPSLPKAEKALKENKLDEAKCIIDATTANQEFMVNKKGEPSKNAAKAWFLKGTIYAAIDTTKNKAWNELDANAFATVKESYDKAIELGGKDAKGYINDAFGLPIPNENVKLNLAQAYFNKAITEYQDNKDYKKAFAITEQTLYFIPTDTSVLLNAGVYFGPAAEEYDKSIDYMKKYLAAGGKSQDPYIMLFGIYRDRQKNYDEALKIAQDAIKKFPNNSDFPKYELDIFIKTNRLPDAKVAMEKQVNADPNDKESRYYLGVINMELKDNKEARKWFEEALKLDPKYFDAHLAVAEIVYQDAKDVKNQMNQLGITADDKKKRFELDKVYVEKLKIALPYFEQCEKLSPDEPKVLDNLLNIYSDLGNEAQVNRITKKMKALGLLDE